MLARRPALVLVQDVFEQSVHLCVMAIQAILELSHSTECSKEQSVVVVRVVYVMEQQRFITQSGTEK